MLRVSIGWITTRRFPRHEFTLSWRRVRIVLAVHLGALVVLIVLISLAFHLGLIDG